MKYPPIHTWFSQTAKQFREKIALNCGHQQITYGQLEEKANNLANFLLANGVTKDSLIYIVTQDTLTVITAILATLKAGDVFVPLSHQIPPKRLPDLLLQIPPHWMIADEAPTAILDSLNLPQNTQVILNQESKFINTLKNDRTQ